MLVSNIEIPFFFYFPSVCYDEDGTCNAFVQDWLIKRLSK